MLDYGLTNIVLILAVVLAIALAGFLIYKWIRTPKINRVTADLPDGFPKTGFSHDSFHALLDRFVDNKGRTDYTNWHKDLQSRQELEQYIAAIQQYCPEASPNRFQTPSAKLAYWINAYNALVIFLVLKHWPINSVTDVKAPIEATKGMGFFYQNQVIVGGKPINLYTLEHKKLIDAGADPRMHFLLNCASGSCPVLRPVPGSDADMEALLTQAAADFVSEPDNLAIDHTEKTIKLSAIFKWYRKDFIAALIDGTENKDLKMIRYLSAIAPASLASELNRALSYTLIFRPFDWSINSTG